MITQSQRYLLEALKASLFNIEPRFSDDTNWSEVVDEAKIQTVLGLVSTVIPVPNEASEVGKANYLRLIYEQDKLIKCFESEHIPCVVLKGCAAAIYYPKPYLRTMGDIDILVLPERFTDASKVLESKGYIYVQDKGHDERVSDDVREMAYTKNGIIVEIHKRFSSPGVNIDDILEKAICSRVYCDLNGYRFPILPTPENGLVLLGHINQHLKNNVLGLRQVVDWAMYIHSVSNADSFNTQFLPLAERTGLITLAAYTTNLCNRYLGLSDEVDFGISVDDSLSDALMEIILTDGNFGRRAYVNKTVEEMKIKSASYGIKKLGFFTYFTRVGLDTSRFCSKHPSLKFAAFLYGFFRLLKMGIKSMFNGNGVRQNMVEGKQLREMHNKRSELFKKLGVKTGREESSLSS